MKRGILLLGMLPALAGAQAVCPQLAAQIEREQLRMSEAIVLALHDDSAPRHTVKELRISNGWAAISTAISLMQSNRCAPITHPISATAYVKAALDCDKAVATEQEKQACNRTTWRPDYTPFP